MVTPPRTFRATTDITTSGGQAPLCTDQAPDSRHARQEQSQRAVSAWQLRAACAGLPQEIFFPPEGERGRRLWRREDTAKQICLSCPVVDACRAHAVDTGEKHGIWGATTPVERRRLIQARTRARPSTVPVVGDVHPTWDAW